MSQSEAVLVFCVGIVRWCICFFLPFLKSSPVFKLGGKRHCDRGVCNHVSLHSASTFNTRITCDITLPLRG